MAGSALRGKPLKLTDGGTLVTFIALQSGVRAKEGEAILVILNLLDGRVPATNSMALRAVRTELATVNVGMTVSAALADVSEDRIDVALRTANLFVHPAKRIGGLIVIELHIAANRPPAASGMAIFARNG